MLPWADTSGSHANLGTKGANENTKNSQRAH
jgi:hypothetical protein